MSEPSAVLERVCLAFGLGDDLEVRAELHGGVNRVWRVRTGSGDYAIHHLLGLPGGVDALERCAWVASLELAAIRAGVRAPAPIFVQESSAAAALLPGSEGAFIVHEWYDASAVTPDAVSEGFASSLGDALARLHRLDHVGMSGPDILDRRPTAVDWEALATRAELANLTWGSRIRAASPRLQKALATLHDWDERSAADEVSSHRDLTSANLLDDEGVAVLIDWESAGRTRTSAEIGRTALDNFLRGDVLEAALLAAYLDGYSERSPLPPIGLDWCSLWIRGLVVFAEQCAHSLLAGVAPTGLLDFQRQVIEATPDELERRLRLSASLVEQFSEAARR